MDSKTPQNDDNFDIAFSKKGCNCFWLPSSSSSSSSCLKIEHWWTRGWRKLRERSEVTAGRPKWKTLIRRLKKKERNSTNRGGGNGNTNIYQYDPLSYSLNFDEGYFSLIHNDDDDEDTLSRAFSSRYASVPPSSTKSSMDLDG
ncbi:hypothetical protein ACFE04_004978 [Oxalis oulophora]